MSYDLYIETGDRQVESVFNCSVFNLLPFTTACIDALARKIRIRESHLRIVRGKLSEMINPPYIQGELIAPRPASEDAIAYQREVVEAHEQELDKLQACQKAWIRFEQGQKVSFVDLCMVFTFDFPEKFLNEREEDYARWMIASLADCARHHGDVQAYFA